MSNGFKKAERSNVMLRVNLMGPSGSGKTYSALRLASGMSDKIALIDTENSRSEVYADEFTFDVMQFAPPHSPQAYIQCIEAAEKAGYEILIIDSISHEWSGRGGILDIKDKMPGGNEFTKWGKLTPMHNSFLEKLIQANMHLITTVRGKDQYVLEANDKGKQVPKKVGVGGQQRDGIEYEFTVSFILDQVSHVATVTKDNTHLFEEKYERLEESHGKLLLSWASKGRKIRSQETLVPVREVDTALNIVMENTAQVLGDELEELLTIHDSLLPIEDTAKIRKALPGLVKEGNVERLQRGIAWVKKTVSESQDNPDDKADKAIKAEQVPESIADQQEMEWEA